MTELEKEIVDIIGHSLKLYVRIPENTVVNYDLQGSELAASKIRDLIQSYCQKQKEIMLKSIKDGFNKTFVDAEDSTDHFTNYDYQVLIKEIQNAPLATEGE